MNLPRLRVKLDLLSKAAAVVLVILVILGVLARLVGLGGDPTAMVGTRLSGPTWSWPLGTDSLGRSVFSRVLDGIGTTVIVATVAVLITSVLGALIGIMAVYRGGVTDQIVVRAADVLFSFPTILLAMVISAVVGPGSSGAIVAVVLATLPLMLRVVRGAALSIAPRDFVVSSRVSGASFVRVAFVHLLPNVAGAAVVQATYALSVGMLVESGLSFLGLGVQPPDASLGSLMREGYVYLSLAPWSVIGPGVVLALAVLSVNLIGDGLRDLLDPRETRSLS